VKMKVRVSLKCTKHSTFLTSPLEVIGELNAPALNPLKDSRCACSGGNDLLSLPRVERRPLYLKSVPYSPVKLKSGCPAL